MGRGEREDGRGGEEIERRDALRATVSVETTLFVTSREREGKINRKEGKERRGISIEIVERDGERIN